MRWADSLPDEGFREVIAVRVASAAAAQRDGAELAAEWSRDRVRTDDRLSSFPRRVGTRWVRHDPEAAMAGSIAAGADRDDGVGETYRAWLIHDHPAAFAWAEKVEMQPWNEPALSLYARAQAHDNPRKGMEVARKLSDAKLRDPTTIVVGRVWVESDRDAAEAWFEEVGLPENLREQARMISANAARERTVSRRGPRAQVPAQTPQTAN